MERLWLQRACESGFGVLSFNKVHSCHHIAAQELWVCVWCCCWLHWCCCYQCRLVGGCLQGSCRLCVTKNNCPARMAAENGPCPLWSPPVLPSNCHSLQGFYNTDCLMAALELFSSQLATSFLMIFFFPPISNCFYLKVDKHCPALVHAWGWRLEVYSVSWNNLLHR